MSDTITNPLQPTTTVTDGDWEVDSGGVLGASADAIREALADTPAMPALQIDENGDEISGPGSPAAKRAALEQQAAGDAFARATPAATPDQTAGTDDGDTAEDAPAAKPTTPAAKPKKQSHQERIAEINARIAERTRAKHEAERAAPSPAAPAAPASPASPASPRAPLARPSDPSEAQREGARMLDAATAEGTGNEDLLADRPEWSQFDAEGKDYKEFEKADRAWLAKTLETIQERAIARAADRAQAADVSVMEAAQHRDRVAAVKAKYQDFDQAREALTGVPTTPFLKNLIQRTPAGMEVMYHLGKHPEDAELLSAITQVENDPHNVLPHVFHAMNDAGTNPVPVLTYLATHPEEAQALLDLPPQRALIKLGQILAAADAKTSGPPAKSAPKPIPFTPVDGGSSMRASADDDPEPADDAPDDVWFAWGERRRARERRG